MKDIFFCNIMKYSKTAVFSVYGSVCWFFSDRIGTGESSEILNTRTKGKKPEIPEVHRFVEVSSVSINLHLKAWQDGGCPMNYFVVEYKPR